jgi:hypothetical protein
MSGWFDQDWLHGKITDVEAVVLRHSDWGK